MTPKEKQLPTPENFDDGDTICQSDLMTPKEKAIEFELESFEANCIKDNLIDTPEKMFEMEEDFSIFKRRILDLHTKALSEQKKDVLKIIDYNSYTIDGVKTIINSKDLKQQIEEMK